MPEQIDPAAFRAAVLEAWTSRPLQDRREALDRMIERITLSTGGAHIDYRVKQHPIGPDGFHQPDPSGPPWGKGDRYRLEVRAEAVRRPRARAA